MKAAARLRVCLLLLFACAWMGCGVQPDVAKTPASAAILSTGAGVAPAAWDATPKVLIPEAPGVDVIKSAGARIDLSNKSKGYITVLYQGDFDRALFEARVGARSARYFLRPDVEQVIPLGFGDGEYLLQVQEIVAVDDAGRSLAITMLSGFATVAIEDEFSPFLYPNLFINFDRDSKAVAMGEQLARGAASDKDVLARVYEWVVENIEYDYDVGDDVIDGTIDWYLPDIDAVLESGKGICFDYSAVMAAMLRSQGIPARMVHGYGGDVYHAWLEVHIKGIGWVKAIYFDGQKWQRMDPTFASTSGKGAGYIGDGIRYSDMYYY